MWQQYSIVVGLCVDVSVRLLCVRVYAANLYWIECVHSVFLYEKHFSTLFSFGCLLLAWCTSEIRSLALNTVSGTRSAQRNTLDSRLTDLSIWSKNNFSIKKRIFKIIFLNFWIFRRVFAYENMSSLVWNEWNRVIQCDEVLLYFALELNKQRRLNCRLWQ